MSYNGSGVYSLPGAQLANGQIVSATENNEFRNDVASALNTAWTRDGQAPATDDIPMGNNKLTGLAVASVNGDALSYGNDATVDNLTATGATVNFSGESLRIQADFRPLSSGDKSVRAAFQSNQAGGTTVCAIPNGTVSTNTIASTFRVDSNTSYTGNGHYGSLRVLQDNSVLITSFNDAESPTYLPLVFAIGVGASSQINPTGEFLIAGSTDQGAYNLQVAGTGVWAAGAYVNGSDSRIKENVESLDSCLDVVKAMRPVTYQYKQNYSKDRSIQPGFIAQELQTAMAGKNYIDGVVQEGKKQLNVAYQNIIPILTKAIQEQQEQIEQLKSEVLALKGA